MRKSKQRAITAYAFIFFLILSSFLLSEIKTGKYLCVGVSDGDTIWVMIDGEKTRVKIDGIDCPELGQNYGIKAKQFVSQLIDGKACMVNVKGYNKSNMPHAVIFIAEKDVGCELLNAGLAWVFSRYKEDNSLYSKAELSARARGIGLWADPNPIEPWEFREKALKLLDDKSFKLSSTPPAKAPSTITNPSTDKNDTKYVEGCKDFESEIENIVKTDLKQLLSRWDQFVTACLINSDSKKYLSGRKWFQFYEDLINEGSDVPMVNKIKYYDNPTCISYETEINNLINSIKNRIIDAEKNASSAGVYAADITSIEKKYIFNRKEWKEIEMNEILKQKDIRDKNWLN